jgi:uncharacterized paraquat-inducible protein A
MEKLDAPLDDGGWMVVCSWCGDVIRRNSAKPTHGMCQRCFARMMREHSRSLQRRESSPDASDR